jgi:cell division transport system permease protein
MLVDTVGTALRAGNEEVSFSVYLEDGVRENPELPRVLEQRLREMPGVADVQYIPPSEALSRFERLLGAQAGILAGYEGDNPLPGSFSVQVTARSDTLGSDTRKEGTDSAALPTEELVERISELSGVEAVVYDQSLHHSLAEMLSALSSLAWILVPLLCLVVAFMVASTVRLALHEHRDEIAIMRLMGASHRYVCAPFYAAAVLQGVTGAVIGLCVVRAGFGLASMALADTPLSSFVVMPLGLSWWVGALVVFLGIATALLGSILTLRKFSAEV